MHHDGVASWAALVFRYTESNCVSISRRERNPNKHGVKAGLKTKTDLKYFNTYFDRLSCAKSKAAGLNLRMHHQEQCTLIINQFPLQHKYARVSLIS